MIQTEIAVAEQKLMDMLNLKLKPSKPDSFKKDLDKAVKGFLKPAGVPDHNLKFSDVEEIKELLLELDPGVIHEKLLLNNDILVVELVLNIVQYLQSNLPLEDQSQVNFMIEQSLGASRSNDTRFLWTARVAEDPLEILYLMQSTKLTKFDVQHLQAMYPETYDLIIESVITAVTDTFTVKDLIPRRIKMMLSILLGLPVVSIKALEAYNTEPEPEKNTPSISSIGE